MKQVSKILLGLIVMAILVPLFALAQEAATQVAAALPAAPQEPELKDIFNQVLQAIGDWKKIGWQAGLAGLLTAIIGTMKNSLLRQWIWSKVPDWAKVLVAPVLGIAIFALGMQTFDAKVFIAGLTTGVAAVYLHQLLDALKQAPFVGEKVKSFLDFLGKLMKKPAAEEAKK